MSLKKFFTKPFILLFLSACLSAVPLTFSNAFWLSWVSFVPIFYVIITNNGDKFRFAIGHGFLFGFMYHICIYYWFLWFYPLDYVNLNKSASAAVVMLAWFGISAAHGILWCIPFGLCHFAKKLSNNKLILSLIATLGIIAAQKLTQTSELSFPWARISLGQYKATALIQSASIWGVDGVDMIILLINALIAIAILTKNKKRILALAFAMVIFLSNLGFGLAQCNKSSADSKIKILTVQGSIPQDKKWASDGDTVCYDAYSSLTKENLGEDIDLILWPESAVPTIYKSEKSLKQYKKLAKEAGAPIIAGVILNTPDGNTNNAALITDNKVETIYTKRQLVPFGEYMPYKKLLSRVFPVLTQLNIIEDDYISGKSSAIMSVESGKIGSVICFESAYPHLARQSALDGAELMIEFTNDSWLETSPAMYQHLAHGVFRSIENDRYLVRSANSGISAVIDNHGNIISQLDINKHGVIIDTAQFSSKQTPYTKTGDVLFPVFCTVVFILLIISFIKEKKSAS